MKRSIITVVLSILAIQLIISFAFAREQTLYPGDAGTLTPINDSISISPVRLTICTNAERAIAMQGRSQLYHIPSQTYYMDTGWASDGMSLVENMFVPAVVLQNTLWICALEEINQPGGYIKYSFVY